MGTLILITLLTIATLLALLLIAVAVLINMNKLKRYKESNFNSLLEFVMCFGTTSFENGGYIVFIYGWGGITYVFIMLILKANGWLC